MTLWGRSAKNPGAAAIADSLQFGSLTDVGVVRSENQDAMGFRVPDDPEEIAGEEALFVVADGMGGHKGGATASRLAVKTILDRYFNSRAGEPGDRIRSAIEAANQAVLQKSQADKGLDGMGTTVVALIVRPPDVFVAHVGDSRAYLVRDGRIVQLTKDHSLVQQWVDQGVMRPEEARHSGRKNVLTRVVGSRDDVEIDLLSPPHVLAPGDQFVLCSDGLHGLVEDDEIRRTVSEMDPQEACARLVTMARDRGGPDNITVQIVSWMRAVPVQAPAGPERVSGETTRVMSPRSS